jgi:hypothetical protein
MMLLLAAVLAVAPIEWKSVRGTVNLDPPVTHQAAPSVRVDASSTDALIRAREVKLTPGKRYRLEGWLRSRGLKIEAGDRTTVPTGVSLGMRSMPWDVHSTSISGTRDWTRSTLDFTATRSSDWPEIRIAPGSTFAGQAWVSGVSVTEISAPPRGHPNSPCAASAPPIATERPAGRICTSRVSPSSAASSTVS